MQIWCTSVQWPNAQDQCCLKRSCTTIWVEVMFLEIFLKELRSATKYYVMAKLSSLILSFLLMFSAQFSDCEASRRFGFPPVHIYTHYVPHTHKDTHACTFSVSHTDTRTHTHTRTLISLSVEWRPLSRIMSPLLPWKSLVLSLGWNMSLLVLSDRRYSTDELYGQTARPAGLFGLWVSIS